MDLLGGHQRKTVLQVKAHLMTEHGACASTDAVGFVGAMFINVAHWVGIRPHTNAGEEAVRLKSGEPYCNVTGAASTVPAVSGSWPGRMGGTVGLAMYGIVDVARRTGQAGWFHRLELLAGGTPCRSPLPLRRSIEPPDCAVCVQQSVSSGLFFPRPHNTVGHCFHKPWTRRCG